MKAFIYYGKEDIRLEELPNPVCGDNDIVIKNLYAGICGSDVSAYRHGGDDVIIFKNHEFGHEMVSEVVEVGKNVEGIEVGDRVYPYPMTVKGNPMRAATVGGFSELIHVPDCKLEHSVFKVDEAISTKEAAMIEPFTVGFHAAKQGKPAVGKKAIVFGSGMIGTAAAIGLKVAGVEQIMVVDISDFRLGIVNELGFEICNSANEDLKEKAGAYFGTIPNTFAPGESLDVDIYIDATGIAPIPKTFQAVGKKDSVLVVVGVHHQPREIDLLTLTYNQQVIVGSAGYDMDDVRDVLNMMKSKKFNLETIITHEYQQDDLEQAIFKAMDANETLKVVIKY